MVFPMTPVRFERTAFSFGGRRSNPLSYRAEMMQFTTRARGDVKRGARQKNVRRTNVYSLDKYRGL